VQRIVVHGMLGFGVLLVLLVAGRPCAAQVITPDDAARHVGADVIVEGEVATVICSPLACIVSFSADYSGLAASIPGDVVGRFPSPRETYANRRVRLRGTVLDRNGRPRIEVTDPAALQVIGGAAGSAVAASAASGPVIRVDPSASVKVTTEPPELGAGVAGSSAVASDVAIPPPPPRRPALEAPGSGGASQSRVVSPGVVTSRMGGPRPPAPEPRGDSLVARLNGGGGDAAAVESRSFQQRVEELQDENASLATAVQELQDRLTAMEQAGGARGQGINEADLPNTPVYVVPGDRSIRLQAVKRGWSSERLLRAVGPPLNTVTEANGYMTWYYANGRAVTLDPRGRVSSSIGF
jgi:hypothetical protein